MRSASLAAMEKANLGPEVRLRRSGSALPPAQAIARLARKMWPTKTDKELAVRTGKSDRACREILAGGNMKLDTVANLLRSEEGEEFLIALLGDASPAWRRRLERSIEISRLRAEIEAQRAKIARLEQAMGTD